MSTDVKLVSGTGAQLYAQAAPRQIDTPCRSLDCTAGSGRRDMAHTCYCALEYESVLDGRAFQSSRLSSPDVQQVHARDLLDQRTRHVCLLCRGVVQVSQPYLPASAASQPMSAPHSGRRLEHVRRQARRVVAGRGGEGRAELVVDQLRPWQTPLVRHRPRALPGLPPHLRRHRHLRPLPRRSRPHEPGRARHDQGPENRHLGTTRPLTTRRRLG